MKHLKTKPVSSGIDEPSTAVKRKGNWKVKTAVYLLLAIVGCYGLNTFFNRYYLVSPVLLQSPVRVRGSIYPIKINEAKLDTMIDEAIDDTLKTLSPTPVKSRENGETSTDNKKIWSGTASVYSEAGCLGCNAKLIMANGEKFTDYGYTVAFNKLPLNTMVRVTNLANNLFVEARVTDRGGFEKYNRIIDLGTAPAEAINCKGLCQVKVEEL